MLTLWRDEDDGDLMGARLAREWQAAQRVAKDERRTRMICDHTPAAVCLLCSDAVPWWRQARQTLELGEAPPNARAEVPIVPCIIEQAAVKSCTMPNCHGMAYADDLCFPHYQHAVRLGVVKPFEGFKQRVGLNLTAEAAWRARLNLTAEAAWRAR